MKYRVINEFDHFEFHEVHISDVEVTDGFFHIVLDDVIILPENSCNRDIRKMRANALVLKFDELKGITLVEEGYKTYDANGNFLSQTEDVQVPKEEYKSVFDAFCDGYAFSIEKVNDTYTFVVDATNEHTYSLTIEAGGDIAEWDRFLSIEM